MSTTTITKNPALKKGSSVMIRPFFDGSVANMGLEKYNMSLHDGVYHEEQLACIDYNGIQRYITGLNEFAPEVKFIEDDDEREAKIKEIRIIVAELEKSFASNIISPEDPDFWNKVKLLKPDNHEFWGPITIRCGNEPVYLDPAKDPYDLIKLRAIEVGGFSMVARSLEDARTRPVAPKFYLDRYEDTAATKTELKKMRNKALAELQKLYDKHPNKMFYVAKVIDPNSPQYKKNTPNDVIYDNMDNYINGRGTETNLRRAAETFLSAVGQDMETLKIRALIKDATFHRFILTKGDGFIYHIESNTMMGKNPSDVTEFLKNPLNSQILEILTTKIEKYWNS